MNVKWGKGALVALVATLLTAGPGEAQPRRHVGLVTYGEPVGSYALGKVRTVDIGRQPSAAAAIRAARRARVPAGGYALAQIPSNLNGGNVAIDHRGVIHVVVRTAGSGPNQRPPVAPRVETAPQN